MVQGHTLMRNGTEEWFAEYFRRLMFKKLGYTSDLQELRADEAEWFTAIDYALGQARKALTKVPNGKKNV